MISKKNISKIAISSIVVFIVVIYMTPFYFLIVNSFKTLPEISKSVAAFPEMFSLNNYARVWRTSGFLKSFVYSVVTTVFSNLGVVLIASMAAYQLSRHPTKGNKFLYYLFIAEMIIPFQVIMIPLTIVLKTLGLIGTIGGLVFAYWGLGVAFAIFMYCGFIKGIPREIEESAVVDGCSQLKLFFCIVLPLLKPVTFSVIIIQTFWYWNDFLLPLMVLPKRNISTIPIAINAFMGQYVMQWDMALPALVLATVPAAITFILLQKNIVAGLVSGALKG